MFGSRPTTPPPTPSELESTLTALTAATDQVLAIVAAAMRAHCGNRELVDLALDVQLALRPAPSQPAGSDTAVSRG